MSSIPHRHHSSASMLAVSAWRRLLLIAPLLALLWAAVGWAWGGRS